MATITSRTGARSWSVATDWVGDSKPADNDLVVIAADCQMLMNEDLSAFTGLQTVTIQGHETTPGMLYFKDGTSGYLKLRTSYSLVGSSGAAKGRLLANSDGVWGNTGSLAFAYKAVIEFGATGGRIDAQYLDVALYCTNPTNRFVRTYGQVFAEATVAEAGNTLTYTGIAAALPNGRLIRVSAGSGALPAELSADTDYWVVGASGNTIQVAATSGGAAIDLSAGGPINIHSGWYANWGVSGNTLTKTTHGLSNGTAVKVRSSGTLPTPLEADRLYWVVSTATNAISLANISGGTAITLGGSPTGTLDVYAGSTGATSSGGIGGTNPYTTPIMNVLDDVTADAPWITTDGHDRVALVNIGPQAYDQQRVQLTTISAAMIKLSANVDSVQYPGAKIFLSSRNVSIRSTCTGGIGIVDYQAAGSSGGVYICEIIDTAGTGTTFHGYGIIDGTGHTIDGSIMGCLIGVYSCDSVVCDSSIIACSSAISSGSLNEFNGPIAGCITGITSATSGSIYNGEISGCTTGSSAGYGSPVLNGNIFGCSIAVSLGIGLIINGAIISCATGITGGFGFTVNGDIIGCTTAVTLGSDHVLNGSISYCTTAVYAGTYVIIGSIIGCPTTFSFAASPAVIPLIASVRGKSVIGTPTFTNRNGSTMGSFAGQGVFCEDYAQVLGASYAFLPTGDVIKNTTTVRGGGAASSMEVVPLSYCSPAAPVLIFEWMELSVPASAQNKSVYIRADAAWSVYPTADELYIEAEYISNGTTFATTVVKSTAVLNHASNWIEFAIPEFTPSVAGHVRYRGYLKKYEDSRKIYVDNMLVAA